MDSNRVFSEREAAEILQRAAKFQESSGATDYVAGVTLDELKKIAAETGIGDEYLRQALERPSQTTTRLLNLVEETERVINGEVSTEGIEAFTEVLTKYGRIQQPSQIGRTFTGFVNGGLMYAKVELRSKNGRTRLKVKSMPLIAYMIGLHAPLIFSFVLLAALSSHGSSSLAIGASAALLGLGSLLFTYLAKINIQKCRKMADEVENELVAIAAQRITPSRSQWSESADLTQTLGQS